MIRITLLLMLVLVLTDSAALAACRFDISLSPAAANPAAPRMGDNISFRSVITYSCDKPARGVVAWLSLVRVDPGKEQPVDLEDWSAGKAVSRSVLMPGQQLVADWQLRLIQAGDYRVAVTAVEPGSSRPFSSSLIAVHVSSKSVVESRRVIPVAVAIPLLVVVIAVGRFVRSRRRGRTGVAGEHTSSGQEQAGTL